MAGHQSRTKTENAGSDLHLPGDFPKMRQCCEDTVDQTTEDRGLCGRRLEYQRRLSKLREKNLLILGEPDDIYH